MVIETLGHKHSETEEPNHYEASYDHENHDHSEANSEFRAIYELSCEQADILTELDFSGLFCLYPAIEDLDVPFVIERGQGSAELNALSDKLIF